MLKERFTIANNYNFTLISEKLTNIYNRKKLSTARLPNTGGRVAGSIIVPRRGHLNKRLYRYVDFKRLTLPNQSALFLRTIYDPNRSAALGLVCYPIGILSYILKPAKIQPGDFINNFTKLSTIYYGDASPLKNFSSGVLIYNIDGKFTKSAGCSTILVRKDQNQILAKLKSGELRYFNHELIATSGSVSNPDHFLRNLKKASIRRYLGFRPRTRPCSMNPVDHPLGGRTRGGSFPKNYKGIITLNRPTVKRHSSSILYTKRQLKLLR